MKILILLLYWERPLMVRNALKSILRSHKHHPDWHLAFIDDSSPTPGRPVCEEILQDHLDQVTFYHTEMTAEEKLSTGGMVGAAMNQAIRESDAKAAIMLCDDDELCPEYLRNLNTFFLTNPGVPACHSHVYRYNPAFEKSDLVTRPFESLNHKGRIELAAQVDASQVAWRTSLNHQGVWFAERKTKCLDYAFYRKIDARASNGTPFSGFHAQYKSVHPTALVSHDLADLWAGKTIDLPECEELTPVWSIKEMAKVNLSLGNKEQARLICEKGISLHPQETELYILLSESCADV